MPERHFFIVERAICTGCFGSGEATGSRGGACFSCKGEGFADKRVSLGEALNALGITGAIEQLQGLHENLRDRYMRTENRVFGDGE